LCGSTGQFHIPVTTYHVANWGECYENNRSRKVKELAWVPIPNKHDGERYSRLMLRKDASQIFAAWILILQVASRCQPRGSLLRSDGTPHDSDSLSVKTRAPRAWFDLALPVLVEMKWLSSESVEQASLALDCHGPATVLPPSCCRGDEERTEENRIEGNGFPPTARVEISRTAQVEEIYAAYPRKEAKQDAIKAITKALAIHPAIKLLTATKAYAAAVAAWIPDDRKYVPHPATWFNRGSYEDDPATWARSKPQAIADPYREV